MTLAEKRGGSLVYVWNSPSPVSFTSLSRARWEWCCPWSLSTGGEGPSERDAMGTERRAATVQLPLQVCFSQEVADSSGIPSSVYNTSVLIFFLVQDSDFMSVTGLLTGSVKRFSTMTRSGRDNRKLLCSVSAGLIVVFFILYYLVSKAGT